jgi:hypothetical protein
MAWQYYFLFFWFLFICAAIYSGQLILHTMNTDDYSLGESYVKVGGEGGIQKSVDEFAKKWIGGHYMIAFAAILVLSVVVIFFAVRAAREGFNPTQNLRDQDSDQFGLGKREYMEGDRSTSVFAQQVQGTSAQLTIDPNAKANQPGSLAYQVLHSDDFNCNNRKMAGDDAWAWMNNVAHESMHASKPQSDNDFSKVLTGQ